MLLFEVPADHDFGGRVRRDHLEALGPSTRQQAYPVLGLLGPGAGIPPGAGLAVRHPRDRADDALELIKNPALTRAELARILGCHPKSLMHKGRCPLLALAT